MAATKTKTKNQDAPKRRGRPPGSKNQNGAPKNAKTFKLYAVEGNELAFITESKGPNGKEAVRLAVAGGNADPDTPIVALSPHNLSEHIVETEEPTIRYRVKSVSSRKRGGGAKASTTKAKPGPKPGAKKRGRPPKNQAPVEPDLSDLQDDGEGERPTTGSNPFAE